MQDVAIFKAFFQHHDAKNSAVIWPYFEKVHHAWENADAFIELSDHDAAMLRALNSVLIGDASQPAPLILDAKQRLFIGKTWALEQEVGHHIRRLINAATTPICPADQHVSQLKTWFRHEHEATQQQAAALALISPFLLITGGPGTGKTTTIAKILALLCQAQPTLPKIALAAPTGKAAAHMQASLNNALSSLNLEPELKNHLTALHGTTLHRLLQLQPQKINKLDDSPHLLLHDIVVVDEASMIDLQLMVALLRALKNGARLILLGDAHQLPSVGAGAVLAALSQAQLPLTQAQQQYWQALLPQCAVPPFIRAHLSHSHRFDAQSGIGQLAAATLRGDADSALTCFEQHTNIQWLQPNVDDMLEIFHKALKSYWQAIAEGDLPRAHRMRQNACLLCVLNLDAERINQRYLQQLRQKRKIAKDALFNGMCFMVTQNLPHLDIYNGDIGILYQNDGIFRLHFNRGVDIFSHDLQRVGQIEAAFALTVHKSQGSEYNHVYLSLPSETFFEHSDNQAFIDRQLIYTAITRAKESFSVQGSPQRLAQAITNHRLRLSAINEWLSPI